MSDAECIAFLRWALPRLRLRWGGFRRVRRQVRKRLQRRLDALGLPDLPAYRARLEADPGEWGVLGGLCRIPISRFWRHAGLWSDLARLLPSLALPGTGLRCWSAGCASGEEPYTLAILAGELGLEARILATDADPALLARARAGAYGSSSLKEMPPALRAKAFERAGDRFVLRPELRLSVTFAEQDIRQEMPDGPFHLVLCRYLAFTYFDEALQREVLSGLGARLLPGGLLAIGSHESLPAEGWHTRAPCLFTREETRGR